MVATVEYDDDTSLLCINLASYFGWMSARAPPHLERIEGAPTPVK